MLPNVTKMIPIGWRATEAEFLQKLKSSRLLPRAGIRNQINLLVVTGSQDGAEQTLRNLTNVGGTSSDHFREREPVSTGFTGLIRNSETLEVFLRAS